MLKDIDQDPSSVCKNIAFSDDGKCLLGDKCICESNKKWFATNDEPKEESQDELWDEIGEELSHHTGTKIAIEFIHDWRKKFTISRK